MTALQDLCDQQAKRIAELEADLATSHEACGLIDKVAGKTIAALKAERDELREALQNLIDSTYPPTFIRSERDNAKALLEGKDE